MSLSRESKSQQKRIKNPTILVRSKFEPREDQVDLCPRIWSREFSKGCQSPESRDGGNSFHLPSKAWRLCFYCSCLPICYPCYVSRSLRRRRRRGAKSASTNPQCRYPNLSETDAAKCNLFDTSGDTMGKTMFHRVSQRKKDSDECIGVNVILLRSESSPKLERYLATKREKIENNEDELNKVIEITKQISDQPILQESSLPGPNDNESKGSGGNQQTTRGDNKSWRTLIQLQKLKQSFRRRNIERPALPPKKVPSLNLEVLEEENLESIKSSVTEFFDARSIVSTEDENYFQSFESGRPSRNLLSCDSLKVCQKVASIKKKVRHHVKPLGTRTVECEGIGYKLQVSIFDEGTITNWSGSDLDQLGSCNIDLVIIIISNSEEIDSMMNLNKGLLHYLGDYWRGFYPLLMVELADDDEDLENESNVAESSWCLTTLFGDVYHLRLKENELFESVDWLTDVMGRLYLHSRLYQCSKFYGKGINNLTECPGGCQLSKINANKRSHPFVRKKVKWKMKSLVRFSKLANEQSSVKGVNGTKK